MTPNALLPGIGLILALVSLTSQAQPLAIAVVRADGILVPVAVYDNGAWVEAWPEPSGDTKLDRMIAAPTSYWRERGMEIPQVWHVARRGAAAAPVKVLTTVLFDEHCGHQVGLLTDLPARKADSHEKTLAADRAGAMDLPRDLTAPGRARTGWSDLIDAAHREIARQETAAIASWEEQSKRKSQLEPPARRRPVRITSLHAYSAAGVRLLYYEAERRYANPIWKEPNAEAAVLVAAGWIHERAGSPAAAVDGRAVITDMDFKEVLTMTPLGVVRAGGAAFWVSQDHGYESEAVSLHRISPAGVHQVFSKFIGGC